MTDLAIYQQIEMKESRTARANQPEPAEDAIARVAVSLTGKESARTLLLQIGESFDETG
jgi:hypothetical protein